MSPGHVQEANNEDRNWSMQGSSGRGETGRAVVGCHYQCGHALQQGSRTAPVWYSSSGGGGVGGSAILS